MIMSALTDLQLKEQKLTDGYWEYLKSKKQAEVQYKKLSINIV